MLGRETVKAHWKRQRKTLAFNVKIKESNRSGWRTHSFRFHWHSLFSTDSFHIHYPFSTFVAINVSEWSDGLFKNTQEFREQKAGKAIICLTCREWGQKEPFTVCYWREAEMPASLSRDPWMREWGSFLWLSQVKHKVNQMNLKPLHSVRGGYTPNARCESTFHRLKRLQWSQRKETKCWRTASLKELGKTIPADEREFVPLTDHDEFHPENKSCVFPSFPGLKQIKSFLFDAK